MSPPAGAPERWQGAAAALVGAACFAVLLGPRVLDPRAIGWLAHGDPSQYYLAWSFFRATPWTWPPADNPAYGLELGSTIFFADLVPGLALLLKATIAPPEGPWQYHGAWLLGCFVLQAVVARRIAALFLADRACRLLVAALACTAPVLLWRLAGPHAHTGHYTLAAQWLPLAAAWLCLRPPGRRQGVAWVALGAGAALVHAYLLAMVLALWLADLARRAIAGSRGALAAEALAMAPALAAALWLAGFRSLEGGGLADRGMGLYRANLLALVDPQGWSLLLPGLPRGAGDYEGFAFLGLGGLAALAAAAWLVPWRIPARGRWPFLAVVGLLAMVAASTTIGLGGGDILAVEAPPWLDRVLALLRAPGRMIWPLHYLLLLGAAILLARRLGARRGRLALAAMLALQVVDGLPGWLPVAVQARIAGPAWDSPLRDPFWAAAGARYARLRRIPAENAPPGWRVLARFALDHRLPTDAAYLARVPHAPLLALQARGAAMLATGRFDLQELYVLDDAAACAAAAAVDPSRDLLMRLDGVNVLAPGWLPGGPLPAAARPVAPCGR